MEVTHHLSLILGGFPKQGSLLALTVSSFRLHSLDSALSGWPAAGIPNEGTPFCPWPSSLRAYISHVY